MFTKLGMLCQHGIENVTACRKAVMHAGNKLGLEGAKASGVPRV